jgi:CubicO group peptidase (beta-lactamase class C family)
MIMSRTIPAALCAALLLAAGQAQAAGQPAGRGHVASASNEKARIDKARIDKALAQMVASGRAAGVSALIWQDGAERYFGTAGFADREAARPMTRDTLVQIYSMTKPVTGVALMQLWEQGRFGLDDPLAKYLPEFANMQVRDGADTGGTPTYRPTRRPILIRDILRHTAGFGYGSDPAFRSADPLNLQNDLTEMGRRVSKLPLLFEPGAEWRYSAAVDIQALLVERLTGVPFESYVRANILDPLGMKETAWTQPAERMGRLAATYVRTDGKLSRQEDAKTQAMNFAPRRLTMGGAGLAGPIDDYMRFARMLLGDGSLDGVRILRPSTVRLMATDHLDPAVTKRDFLPGKGSVGFGFDFAVRTSRPKDAAENRGAVGEFFWDGAETTLFWVDPANRLAAVFFVQTLPFDGTLHHDFRTAVYGPDYLGPAGDEARR